MNKTRKGMNKDYVSPEIEVVEVLVEHGFVHTTPDAFGGDDGIVITPGF